jgi:hypothetical protein
LLSKLENNKTKVNLKESNKKISILFNLLFYNIIVGGMVFRTKRTRDTEEKKTFKGFIALQQKKKIDKKHQQKLKKVKKNYVESIATGKRRWRAIVITKLILRSLEEKYGPEIARETKLFMSLRDMLFQDILAGWVNIDTFKQSLKNPVPRPYDKIYPIVQQSYVGSCWINAILVALMYPYYLKEEFLNIIILLLTAREQNLQQQQTQSEINKASFARIIQDHLHELLVLQYGRNSNMTGKECIRSELSFVSDFIKQLTDIEPDIFKTFSQVKIHQVKKSNDKINDIILNGGGTTEDIFELIKILLENGFKFTEQEDDSAKLYTKTVDNKIIRIRVVKKPANSNPYPYLTEVNPYLTEGFTFASIILYNYYFSGSSGGSGGSSGEPEDPEEPAEEPPEDLEDSAEEPENPAEDMDVSGSSELAAILEDSIEKEPPVGHVITLVTDNNGKLFFYNGWMYDNIVTPLQLTNGNDIQITPEDNKTLYFDLVKSFGIMILLKVETVS